MTYTTTTAKLAAQLITAVTGIDQKSDPENFELCRAFTLKSIRENPYSSTNKFAVREQLDGLEEKFRILQNDQLADELYTRRQNLTTLDFKIEPEALHLLLELSTNPINQAETILDKLTAISLAAEAAAERAARQEEEWRTFNADDSGEEQGLWDVVDFTAHSSDEEWNDDDEAVFSKMHKENKRRPDVIDIDDADEFDTFNIEDYIQPVKRTDLIALENSQYWEKRDFVNKNSENLDIALTTDLELKNKSHVSVIPELYVVREVLFMLYGLPCSLFRLQDDNTLIVNSQYATRHTSVGILSDVLNWFGSNGTKLRKLRAFAKQNYGLISRTKLKAIHIEAIASRRSFIAQIEAKITKWEQDVLVPLEETFVVGQSRDKRSVLVSLIDLQQQIESTLKPFLILYEIVEEFITQSDTLDSTERGYKHLDLLFECACELQALGDATSFKFVTEIFFPCLNTYLRPIVWWMETGELRDADGEGAFFVESTPSNKSRVASDRTLATLWHSRYIVKKNAADGTVKAPKFMQKDAQNIYVTGKSVLFIQRLQGVDFDDLSLAKTNGTNMTLRTRKVDFGSLCNVEMFEESLTAFEDLFAASFSTWVGSMHMIVSKEVRDVLYYDCGLFDTLECLADVYFMRDGYAATSFCTGVFDKVEKGREGWDDRFLLTELLQSVFVDNEIIDISRLTVKNSERGMTKTALKMSAGRRSVKSLTHLTVDYKISWPIMNVIGIGSLELYRKIWTLLFMIRRAKFVLQKVRLKQDVEDEKLPPGFYLVRWKLISFVGLLHSYITDMILLPQTKQMKLHLPEAADVDGMIDIHHKYITRVHDLCLLGSQFGPLHQSMISLFDLAVVFADDYTVRVVNKSSFEASNRSLRNISTQFIRPVYKKRQHSESGSGDDDNSESDTNSETESASASEQENHDTEDDDNTSNSDDDNPTTNKHPTSSGPKRDRRRKKIDLDTDGDTTFIPAAESFSQSMDRMSNKYDQLLGFVIAGLKSIARAGVYTEHLDILAERLEMGAMAGGMRSQDFEWERE